MTFIGDLLQAMRDTQAHTSKDTENHSSQPAKMPAGHIHGGVKPNVA